MLRNLLSILSFVCFTSSLAQTPDPILATVTYKVRYIQSGNVLIEDHCLLDISKSQSYFYSKGVHDNGVKRTEMRNQAAATNTPFVVNAKDFNRGKLYRATTLKTYDKKQAITIQIVGMRLLGYVKDFAIDEPWNILSDTATISGLKCQKAQIRKHDFLVTAWFCRDIPIKEGPFFYAGLPGLIIKSQSSEGWEAMFSGIHYPKNPSLAIKVVDYVLVTEEEIKKGN